MDWYVIVLVALWSLWVTQAVLSVALVRKLLVKQIRRPLESRYGQLDEKGLPKAHLIVPFKGADAELEQTVAGLFTQDYADYDLILVVEDESDTAVPVLKRCVAEYPNVAARIVYAGVSDGRCGQKVHNQLVVLRELVPELPEEDLLLFADSDAVPGPRWVNAMVTAVVTGKILKVGLASGYRWLVPAQGHESGLANQLASIMNSSVASFLGRWKNNLAWGGAMAIRVGVARECDLIGHLEGAITDDYQFSKAVQSKGYRIRFVPDALVASPVDFTWATLANFVQRQYLITRVYRPDLYWLGVLLIALYVLSWLSALGFTIYGLATDAASGIWLWALVPMLAVWVSDIIRSRFRRRIVREAFGQEMVERLKSAFWLDRYAFILVMFLHLGLILQAAWGRKMTWRGISYRVDGPQRVERLS